MGLIWVVEVEITNGCSAVSKCSTTGWDFRQCCQKLGRRARKDGTVLRASVLLVRFVGTSSDGVARCVIGGHECADLKRTALVPFSLGRQGF